MKKWLAVLLAGVMTVSLAACGNGGQTNNGGNGGKNTEEVNQEAKQHVYRYEELSLGIFRAVLLQERFPTGMIRYMPCSTAGEKPSILRFIWQRQMVQRKRQCSWSSRKWQRGIALMSVLP